MLAAAVALAIAYWPSPAPCRVAVHVRPLPEPVMGRTYDYGAWCEIQVDSRAWRWGELCSVLLHEYGHAAGWRDPVTGGIHSQDPSDPMFPVLVRTADACRGKRPARFSPGALIRL